jgi:5'-phosphate synthase pdxT subunit
MTLTAGVVAVQGDVSEHADAIERAAERRGRSAEVVEVRDSGVVPDCDALLMPGGESTTISRLLHDDGIAAEIVDHVEGGKPMLATCAGLIVAARDAGDDRVETLDLVDVTVERNAFGRQKDSFEAPLDVDGLDDPFPGVFIRAPVISEGGVSERRSEARQAESDDVDVLAEWDGRAVAVRDGPVIGTSFHPELTDDDRIHELAFFPETPATQ